MKSELSLFGHKNSKPTFIATKTEVNTYPF